MLSRKNAYLSQKLVHYWGKSNFGELLYLSFDLVLIDSFVTLQESLKLMGEFTMCKYEKTAAEKFSPIKIHSLHTSSNSTQALSFVRKIMCFSIFTSKKMKLLKKEFLETFLNFYHSFRRGVNFLFGDILTLVFRDK